MPAAQKPGRDGRPGRLWWPGSLRCSGGRPWPGWLRRPRRLWWQPLALTLLLPLLASCSTLRYYWQAADGQFDMMQRRRPIDALVADPSTSDSLRTRLLLVQRLRQFAIHDLGLPDNGSYRSYADLARPYVIWNVFAAPALSTSPQAWCFPIAGCVNYRGYFAESAAREQAALLQAQGMDVYVGGVPAYSTLGWLDDPVLNTFVHWPEVELARLLFHELGHQMAFAPGDTTFNESFATAVEDVGVARWIAHEQRPELQAAWAASQAHRQGFQRLVLTAQGDLAALYASPVDEDAKREGKTARLARLQTEFLALKAEWGGFPGFDRWFAQPVNNAQLASVAVYTAQVPAFRALLAQQHDNLPAFYRQVHRLAAADADTRDAALRAALCQDSANPKTSPPCNQ